MLLQATYEHTRKSAVTSGDTVLGAAYPKPCWQTRVHLCGTCVYGGICVQAAAIGAMRMEMRPHIIWQEGLQGQWQGKRDWGLMVVRRCSLQPERGSCSFVSKSTSEDRASTKHNTYSVCVWQQSQGILPIPFS